MEALSRIVSAIVGRGLLLGFLVGSRSNYVIILSYLLFADDTWIFCEANPEHLSNLGFSYVFKLFRG
jgi:hypothetical protein